MGDMDNKSEWRYVECGYPVVPDGAHYQVLFEGGRAVRAWRNGDEIPVDSDAASRISDAFPDH
jgi:hypothetical protein